MEEFAVLTNTDEALAQFYLQDREWDLEVKEGRKEVDCDEELVTCVLMCEILRSCSEVI